MKLTHMNDKTKAKITLVKRPKTDVQKFYGSQESDEVEHAGLLADRYTSAIDPLNVPAFGSTCENKMIITDEPHAIFLAKKMSVKHNRPQEHYKCSECAHWHLTSLRDS